MVGDLAQQALGIRQIVICVMEEFVGVRSREQLQVQMPGHLLGQADPGVHVLQGVGVLKYRRRRTKRAHDWRGISCSLVNARVSGTCVVIGELGFRMDFGVSTLR